MLRRANEPPQVHEQPHWPRVTLRSRDQAVAGVLVAASLAAIGGWCLRQGGCRGELVDIDRAELVAIDFKLDVNEADWPELALLPNIGEQLAKRIVEDRALRGPFRDLADLRRVRGIGPKTLEGMKPYVLPVSTSETTAGASPGLSSPSAD